MTPIDKEILAKMADQMRIERFAATRRLREQTERRLASPLRGGWTGEDNHDEALAAVLAWHRFVSKWPRR